jgi:hypothetical protein
MTNQVVKNILILNSPEDSGPAIRELEGLLQQFESMFADSKSYPQAKAYLVSPSFELKKHLPIFLDSLLPCCICINKQQRTILYSS